MLAHVCVQATIPAFQDGKWHPSLLPVPWWYMRTYSLEYRVATLHRLQTSSVAVVKECLHTVDVAMAEDLFACPFSLVSEFFNRGDQVTFNLLRAYYTMLYLSQGSVCVCVTGYSQGWGFYCADWYAFRYEFLLYIPV